MAKHSCSRKVKCVETGQIFDSCAEAARTMGLKSFTNINTCCNSGGKLTAKGYHWEFTNEFESLPGENWLPAKHLKYLTDELEDIPGYLVSDMGRIVSTTSGHFLVGGTRTNTRSEYLQVNLNGKHYTLHRIVASTFIENPDPLNKTEVNHINEFEKTNNHINNLEWTTPKENSNHGTRTERCTKHCYKKVKCITTGKVFNSMKEAAKYYKIGSKGISSCCNGNQKTAGTFNGVRLKWEYYIEED